jgi:4'-phosphopantetheinyl transferase
LGSERQPLPPGPDGTFECHVWWADLSMTDPRRLALLDPVERARRERYRQPADADRFTLGAVLLRLAAARATGADPAALAIERPCRTCGEQHGRPRVVGSGVHVSVSHSGERVAVAVTAAGPVGVDVETRVTVDPRLGRHVLGPGESATGPRELLRYWVRKESVVKATGDGLRARLTGVVVSRPDEPPRLRGYPGGEPPAAVMADLSPGGDCLAALTVLTAAPVVVRERDAAVLLR